MRKTLLALALLLVSSLLAVLPSMQAMAQEHRVSGKVTGPDGSPLPGITIQVKGTNTGTATDASGKYEITAPEDATLIFRGIGFAEQAIRVGMQSAVNVVMHSSTQQLNELIVTAMGIQRTRNSLPYAAQQIEGSDVNKTITSNVIQNLSGKVAGLQVTSSNAMGGASNVILRGMKSLTQSNQALFVIDGVPYDNTSMTGWGFDFGNAASDINPDDIQSITVLKGAAASALYGSRASNGVILITTKKGSHMKGVGVTASFGVSVGNFDKSTLPVYQTEYGEGYDPTFQMVPIFNSNGQNVPVVETYGDAATGVKYDPTQKVYNWDAFAPGDPNYGKATPWQPAAHHNPIDYFVTPVTTTENVAVAGGGETGTFRIGYTRTDDKGYMPNSNIQKNMFDLDATYNIIKNLSVEGSLNYTNENALNRYLYQYTATTNPMTDFRQWWPTNVDILQQKADYFKTLQNMTWNWQTGAYMNNVPGNIGTPAYHNNLYFNQYQNFEQDSRDRYFGFAKVNYKITDYLNLMGRISKDSYTLSLQHRANVGSSESPSFYERYNRTYGETNYDVLLNFNKDIANNLNLKALLGGNVRQDNISTINASTNGGLVVPGIWALSNSQKAPNAPSESLSRTEVDGIFAGATLSYKQMVTLDGTIRRDKSSTLPVAHDTYYYPSVSANFVFSKLLPANNVLSYGKVWGNYAQVGSDAPVYSLINTYSIGSPLNGQVQASAPGTNNNPNLLPEQNKSYEVGLESNFIDNRIGLTVDYYNAKQFNEIMPITVSRASGFSTFYVNGGTVQNKGVELTLNITPVRTHNFSWDMTINWSKNNNKVLSLYGGQPSYLIAGLQNSISIVAEAGKPYGVIRGTNYVYTNGKRTVDNNGYWEMTSNQADIGNMEPDWIGSFSNTLTYKNLSLSFLLDMRQGGDVYSLDMDYGSYSGLYPRTAGLNDLGKPVRNPLNEGGGIILPGVYESGKPNTTRIDESNIDAGAWSFSSAGGGEPAKTFVYSASYLKLRQVALNYALPASLIHRIGFVQGIDLSLAGRNLWIIHKDLPYADPEQGQASGNASMGFQNGAYPTVRTFDFIVKVRF